MEKNVTKLVKSYQESIDYYEGTIDYAVKHEGGKSTGYYQRELDEVKRKLNILVNKYPEYLI